MGRLKKNKTSATTTETTPTRFRNATEELLYLARCRIPYVMVLTHEEVRFIGTVFEEIAKPRKKDLWIWSAHSGLIRAETMHTEKFATGEFKDTQQAPKVLAKIDEMKVADAGAIFIMRDFHTMITAGIPRQMKDLYSSLNRQKKSLFITAGQLAYGPGLAKTGDYTESIFEEDALGGQI